MSELQKLTTRIIEIANADSSPAIKQGTISNRIAYFVDDILKLARNINETSISDRDHLERVTELETKFGISKTHIIR